MASRTFLRNTLLVAAAAFLAACGDGAGPRRDNMRPTVRITVPGPAERLPYTTRFEWTGADSDGVVDHFEYVVDVPDSVTLDDLNDPDDTGVAWTATTADGMLFTFSTPFPDTAGLSGGSTVVADVDVGDHCLYVRSVDDEGLPSLVDFYCFTAENVLPKTQFAAPYCAFPILEVGNHFNAAWSGDDPDGPEPDHKPSYYESKLIPVGSVLALPFSDLTSVVNSASGVPWVRQDGETASFDLETPHGYVLAIRAVDENGGVENRFIRCRNALVLQALMANPGSPLLTVSGKYLGPHTFPNDGPVAEYETPVARDVTFDLAADASTYGGVVDGFAWSVDGDDPVEDVWSPDPVAGPIRFDVPGLHTVTIKVRDTFGETTVGTVVLKAIAFPLDRDILYVDDYRLSRLGSVSDAMMDGQVDAMLRAAGYPDGAMYALNVWGDDDLALEPAEVRLSDLARYRTLLWSVFGSALSGNTALVEASVCGKQRVLQSYLGAGGQVWLYGSQVWGNFVPSIVGGCMANLSYDEGAGLSFDSGRFPCDFMKICGGDFREARTSGGLSTNGMVNAVPTSQVSSENFPTCEVDSTLLVIPVVSYVDAMFQPAFVQGGGLDTLYTMRSAKPNSAFNNKPVAFRYHDPDPSRSQGEVAVFGFPYHLLKQGDGEARTGVQGLTRSMADWFRSHQGGGM